MRRLILTSLMLSLWASGAEADCTIDTPVQCTVVGYYELMWSAEFAAETVVDDQAVEVRLPVTAASEPSSFAADTHASYASFLNLLTFAFDSVEESQDGRALTIRFNPLRTGENLVGVAASINEPEIFGALREAIPEEARGSAIVAIEEDLGDVEDITWSLSFTRQSTDCNVSVRSCWGRSPAIYRRTLSEALANSLVFDVSGGTPDSFMTSRQAALLVDQIIGGAGVVDTGTTLISEVPVEHREELVDAIREWADTDIRATLRERELYRETGFDHLSVLIDNQPQLSANVSYRDREGFIGPPETTASLELQWGALNLNSVRSNCITGFDACLLKLLREMDPAGADSDKFVLSASYTERDEFDLIDLPVPVDGFEPLHLESNSALRARLQWGRQLGTEISGRQARLDVAIKGERNEEASMRTKDRWVGTATLTIPLADEIILPITLTYANKPEFLGDQREDLGVHFGLTYRFPWEKND